jgi:alpha-glucosidase
MARLWWQDAVVYQVYPRSFADASGDGVGDLAGVVDRIPYIAALGVDAVWLSPFYPSPQFDAGYDVSNPRNVAPEYGTVDDAKILVDACHDRGLRVIVDVVPNHFSIEHPWFPSALKSSPGSPERARFHFRDGGGPDGGDPPNNWVSLFTGPAWTRITEADGQPGQWYLHLFDSSQPDLNWTNPDVIEDFHETLRFWLDLGVDGFRVDVAFGLAKDMTYADAADPDAVLEAIRLVVRELPPEGTHPEDIVSNSAYLDRDEVLDVYRGWREILDSYDGDRMAVAEAWLRPERARRYVASDALHQIFNFDFLVVPWEANTLMRVITSTIDDMAPAGVTWALNNHDTPRVATRLGGGAVGLARARALALLTHALPGSLYLYQGEELGLEDGDIPSQRRQDPIFFRSAGEQLGRDGARVPLPWRGTAPPYGFGGADTWLPQPAHWADYTVAAQERSPKSTLALYRMSLRIRHSHPGLTLQSSLAISEPLPGLLRLERGAGFVCLTNVSTAPVPLPDGTVLLASDRLPESTLPSDTTVWLQT